MRPHEKLEVYWIAQEFAAFCAHVLPRIQKVSHADAHDLDKSSGSIPNNICEAANDSSPGDIARFFRSAKRETARHSGSSRAKREGALQKPNGESLGITLIDWAPG